MVGYTEITIEGQSVGLRFSIDALRIAEKKKAVTIKNGILEAAGTLSTANYLQAAYQVNCLVKEIPEVVTFEQFYNWADAEQWKGDQSELIRVGKVISDSNYVTPKEVVEEKDKKKVKKSTGTK